MDVKIYVVAYYEDDSSKNTALKMVRLGLARLVDRGWRLGQPLVLNPYAESYIGPWLHHYVGSRGILVVDASWRRLNPLRFRHIRGLHARLPPLLAGNPVNYGKPCMLSSIEAVASSLYITGFHSDYERLLKVFKWMTTFHELNKELLEAYSKPTNPNELAAAIADYWGEDPCYNQEVG